MMKPKKRIGLRIKELRKQRGFSQEELGAKADITGKHLSSIELGKENPTLETFLSISSALNVELWELLDYGHELKRKKLISNMGKILKSAKDDDIKTALKILNAIIIK